MSEIEMNIKVSMAETNLQFTTLILPYPLSVCLKMTSKCNFHCPHCSSDSSNQEPNIEKIKFMMKIIRNSGVPKINISGGEPFRHPDINDALNHARKLGFCISVTTNGSLVTLAQVRLMKALDIVPDISLDSAEKDQNDKLRDRGSYDGAIRLIELLNQHGVNFILNSTIQQANFDSLRQIIDFAEKSGCVKLYLIPIRPQGKAAKKAKILLNDKQLCQMQDQVRLFRDTPNKKMSINIMDLKSFPKSFILVEPDGRVISQSYYESDNKEAGNLFNDKDLSHSWNNQDYFDHRMHLIRYTGRR